MNVKIIQYGFLCLILFNHILYSTCAFAFIVPAIGAIGAAFYENAYKLIRCYSECCLENIGSKWIPANISALQESIRSKLYGQHLVEDVVIRALKSHIFNKSPSKALVMSFHGWTGSGKNYVAKFIAESLFKKGTKSKYFHLFESIVHFPHADQVDIYKLQIQDWIRGNVSECGFSVFVFDEIDKMPVGMIDAIKPFIDYHDNIFGIDFRFSIFIFLSNTGSKEINRSMLNLWKQGRERHTISLLDMEGLIQNGAFNEEGGLHNSDLIQHSLVDFYVPFLPLERQHVQLCARDEIRRRDLPPTQDVIDKVLDQMIFFPSEYKLWSSTGCKRVSTKVGYILTDANFDNMFE